MFENYGSMKWFSQISDHFYARYYFLFLDILSLYSMIGTKSHAHYFSLADSIFMTYCNYFLLQLYPYAIV